MIPLLAINAEMAQKVFPESGMNLSAAGRMPNITILAEDLTKLGSRGSDLGEPVTLDDLPPYVVDAFLATEDRRFYQHPGFDPLSVMRAVLINWQAGGVRQGGSTVTQQLVKNLFLSGEQTLERKIEELHLALWLEARLTKDEILELYLNRIYLGANTYGLSAASEAYFSKKPGELTLNEAALLAGLPKAPSTLAPHVNMEGALARSREVVQNLVEARKIDRLTAKMAQISPPRLALRDGRDGHGYFLDQVAIELRQILPDVDEDVIVVTTLDPVLQGAAEAAVKTEIDNDAAQNKGAEQAALVAYDRRGALVAMVGGRSYRDSQFNRATQARRQPGSAFKPFVYLAALENGFDQNTVIIDGPLQVDGWEPGNYKKEYLGPHRLREGLARSSNTSTVQITETIGREVVIEAAQRMGLESTMRPHPSLTLGAFEVPLDELTSAYLPLAHAGFRPETFTILEVRTRSGELIYEHEFQAPPRIVSAKIAESMTDLLKSVTSSGTGRAARVPGHQIAGKTGTTNEWRDAWFVGYSAHITAGVWVGNDEATPMDDVSGATYPARIWRQFMTSAHNSKEYPSMPLDGAYPVIDPELYELTASYAALLDDLTRKAYGARQYRSPQRTLSDGIRGILSRPNVLGRVVRPKDEDGQ